MLAGFAEMHCTSKPDHTGFRGTEKRKSEQASGTQHLDSYQITSNRRHCSFLTGLSRLYYSLKVLAMHVASPELCRDYGNIPQETSGTLSDADAEISAVPSDLVGEVV